MKSKSRYVYVIMVLLFFISIKIKAQTHVFDTIRNAEWVKNIGADEKQLIFEKDTFNVLNYGAINDGIIYTTDPIQKAINQCSASGGGVVLIPKGKYRTGSIFIKSNVHLHFEDSAILLASLDIDDYPERHTRVAGIEMEWPMAILNAVNAQNIKISGNGIVEGRGKTFWDKFFAMKPVYIENGLRWALDYDCKRPRTLVIQNCNNALISDLTLKESPFWTVQILYSEHVTVRGLTILNNENGHGPSSDGINVDSSTDVLVENNYIDCNDDNLCIKAGRDADGLRVNRPSEYVVVRNNQTKQGAGLITFGSEVSGGIKNVYVYNLAGDGTNRGIRMKSARTRGGTVENIFIEDITLKNAGQAFEFTLDWNPAYSYTKLPAKYNYDSIPNRWKKLLEPVIPPEKGISTFKNIYMHNIEVSDTWKAFVAEGFEEQPMDNFVFENVTIKVKTAGHIHNAHNWKFINSKMSTEDGTAIELKNVENMEGL